METEIFKPNIENVEQIEISGNYQEIYGLKTAKSFQGYLNGLINRSLRANDREREMMLRTILAVYEKFHGEELKDIENLKLEIEIISGWKGHGITEVYKGFDNNIRIRVPIKDKHKGTVKWVVNEVKKEHLNRMIHIVKNLRLNEPVSCYEIAKRLNLEWKEIWKLRTKVYFPIYYRPIKVLEAMKIIKYDGNGDVTRII